MGDNTGFTRHSHKLHVIKKLFQCKALMAEMGREFPITCTNFLESMTVTIISSGSWYVQHSTRFQSRDQCVYVHVMLTIVAQKECSI